MCLIFKYSIITVHKINNENACIIAGAVLYFIIQLVFVILFGLRLNRNKED